MFSDTKKELEVTTEKLTETKDTLKTTKSTLRETKITLRDTEQDRNEQRHLVDEHVKTETDLFSQATQVLQINCVELADLAIMSSRDFAQLDLGPIREYWPLPNSNKNKNFPK